MTSQLLEDLRERDLIQTVSIALPTGGRFYEQGILDPEADPNDIEIRAIGVMAEIYARDPFMVAAGKGLARIVSHVCPSVLKPEHLCEVDVEAILIAARLVSHGPMYKVEHVCQNPKKDKEGLPVCAHKSEVEVDLQKTIMAYEPIVYNEGYVVDVPEAGQKVWLKPIEYKDALNVVKRSFMVEKSFRGIVETGLEKFFTDDKVSEEYSRAIEDGAEIAMDSLADCIFCIEASTGVKVGNRDEILKWLNAVPGFIGRRVREAIDNMAATLRNKSEVRYTCPQCGHDNAFPLVLDPEHLFFSKPESSSPQKKPSPTSKRSRRTGTKPPRTSQRSATPSKE